MRLLDQSDDEVFFRRECLQRGELRIIDEFDARLGGVAWRDPPIASGIEYLADGTDGLGDGIIGEQHARAGDGIVGHDPTLGYRHPSRRAASPARCWR